MSKLRLGMKFIPERLWGINLPKLAPNQWTKLRTQLIAARGMRCEICDAKGQEIEAHEVWSYDESQSPAVAKLTKVKLVCDACHSCIHWGRTTTRLRKNGDAGLDELQRLMQHFCKVNGITEYEAHCHAVKASARWRRRSVLEWRVDWGVFDGLLQKANA